MRGRRRELGLTATVRGLVRAPTAASFISAAGQNLAAACCGGFVAYGSSSPEELEGASESDSDVDAPASSHAVSTTRVPSGRRLLPGSAAASSDSASSSGSDNGEDMASTRGSVVEAVALQGAYRARVARSILAEKRLDQLRKILADNFQPDSDCLMCISAAPGDGITHGPSVPFSATRRPNCASGKCRPRVLSGTRLTQGPGSSLSGLAMELRSIRD